LATPFKVLTLLLSVLPMLVAAGCADSQAPGQDPTGSGAIARPQDSAAVPVTIAKAERATFPVELRAIGAGKASKTVSVQSQVAGIVKEVHYRQGQFVRAGDLLVTLDDRLLTAALAGAEAALARDTAQAQLDQTNVQRSAELEKKGLIPRQQYEQTLASAAAAAATVNSDKAAIQTAKLQLSYCSVYAPISGVTGAQLVYAGTTVKANDSPSLVVINQVSPIYVDFSVPQQYLESIKRFMAQSAVAVEATPPGDSAPERGTLTFVNNTVDTTTGTIQLMATFPNTDQRLWPGQFSNVVVHLNQQQNVLTIPAQAVQTGQDGDYVFVMKPDMTVDVRQVKMGQTVDNRTEVLSGLSADEAVVTDGQVRLVPGSKVYLAKAVS
jgi:multidrug efflux system membrane fusion protein